MSWSDPIADMLVRIRNGQRARLLKVDVPYSRLKEDIVRILKREGYIADYSTEGGGARRTITLYLKYDGRQPVIKGIRRVSRPGRRVYAARDSMPRVLNGMGVAILSTSHGVLTDADAVARGIGGEVICTVW